MTHYVHHRLLDEIDAVTPMWFDRGTMPALVRGAIVVPIDEPEVVPEGTRGATPKIAGTGWERSKRLADTGEIDRVALEELGRMGAADAKALNLRLRVLRMPVTLNLTIRVLRGLAHRGLAREVKLGGREARRLGTDTLWELVPKRDGADKTIERGAA